MLFVASKTSKISTNLLVNDSSMSFVGKSIMRPKPCIEQQPLSYTVHTNTPNTTFSDWSPFILQYSNFKISKQYNLFNYTDITTLLIIILTFNVLRACIIKFLSCVRVFARSIVVRLRHRRIYNGIVYTKLKTIWINYM